MVRVTFPAGMQRHLPCPPVDVQAATLRAALDAAFAVYPLARGYVLDEHGALRPHIAVFVDGRSVRERVALAEAVQSASQVLVVQALSGG